MTTRDDPLWPRASTWLGRGNETPLFAVVGVPTSAGSLSPSDAWQTPAALRPMLDRFSTFDGEAGVDLDVLPVTDLGDWAVADLDVPEMLATVGDRVAALDPAPTYAFVGGDNLITAPIAANLPHADLRRTGLLTLDAHHDVRITDPEPSNGSPVRLLVEQGLPGEQVVQVGIHSFANSRAYRSWCDDHGIRVIPGDEVAARGIDRVVTAALDDLAGRVEAIHVDVDLDVLDRAHAPACPGSRPGGLTPRQLATAVRLCGAHPAVVSADFVEVDATRDVADTTMMNLATAVLAFASGRARRATEEVPP